MEVSQVRRRLQAAIEEARRAARGRRERVADAQRGYEAFLADVAVPITRMLANTLKAEGYAFTVATPSGGVRLASDSARDDVIEILLDTGVDPPEAAARISYGRGSRTIAEERPIKPGAAPQEIGEDEFLEFMVGALTPWLN